MRVCMGVGVWVWVSEWVYVRGACVCHINSGVVYIIHHNSALKKRGVQP